VEIKAQRDAYLATVRALLRFVRAQRLANDKPAWRTALY